MKKPSARIPDDKESLANFKTALREAVANYMYSEGCSCCQGDDHGAHKAALAELLSVPQYPDGSGYNFYSFRSIAKAEGTK